MSLPSAHLDAFLALAQTSSFSKAAELLFMTQSALSQKIKALEGELGLTLFLRLPSGARLTEQGERLLRYCQTRESLESELLSDLNSAEQGRLSGTLRVAAYSSVFRSVLIPSLSDFIKSYPEIKIEFICAKMQELPGLLQRAEADFIIMDYKMEKSNIVTEQLGREKFVVIEPKLKNFKEHVYLDNDVNDQATIQFFKKQKKSPKFTRSYFNDCYGIINGVEQGLGKAIMSEHLVKANKSLKLITEYKPMYTDVILHYYKQPFYSKLKNKFINVMRKNSPEYLN